MVNYGLVVHWECRWRGRSALFLIVFLVCNFICSCGHSYLPFPIVLFGFVLFWVLNLECAGRVRWLLAIEGGNGPITRVFGGFCYVLTLLSWRCIGLEGFLVTCPGDSSSYLVLLRFIFTLLSLAFLPWLPVPSMPNHRKEQMPITSRPPIRYLQPLSSYGLFMRDHPQHSANQFSWWSCQYAGATPGRVNQSYPMQQSKESDIAHPMESLLLQVRANPGQSSHQLDHEYLC